MQIREMHEIEIKNLELIILSRQPKLWENEKRISEVCSIRGIVTALSARKKVNLIPTAQVDVNWK